MTSLVKNVHWPLIMAAVPILGTLGSLVGCSGSFCATLAQVAANQPPAITYLPLFIAHGTTAHDTPHNSGGPVTSAELVDANGQPVAAPPGVIVDADGTLIIEAAAIAPRVYSYLVQCSNSAGSVTATALVTVIPAALLTVAYATNQTFTEGVLITPAQLPTLANTTPGLTMAFSILPNPDPLPPGFSFDPVTGAIAGTPSQAGVFSFTVLADNGPQSAEATPIYTVTPAGALALSYPAPPVFPSGIAIPDQDPTVSNETPGASNSFIGIGLPPWLAVDPGTGIITGTPTGAGSFSFTVQVQNAGRTASAALVYTVTAP